MKEEPKIRITYDDLQDPVVDETIARIQKEVTASNKRAENPSPKPNLAARDRKWIYLFIAVLICLLVAWGLMSLIRYLSSPRDQYIQIGTSKYLLSKAAQTFFEIKNESDYKKTRSVLIIEEPHFSIEGQISLYHGLIQFFRDNPSLINRTVFLSEGLPSYQSVSVLPLVDAEPAPDDSLIRKVLATFLIPGYITYAWKYQQKIPVAGIEDDTLYQLSGKLWVETQENKVDKEAFYLWKRTVVARNQRISKTLIEKTTSFENPLLFVGGLHIMKLDKKDFAEIKSGNIGNSLHLNEAHSLEGFPNLGIYDFLKKNRIGYTFLTSKPNRTETIKEMEKNVERYVGLFKSQQNGDYNLYLKQFYSSGKIFKGVTVRPSTEAAAAYVTSLKKNDDGVHPDKSHYH